VIANADDSEGIVAVEIINNLGETVASENVTISAKGQKHINASNLLADGQSGIVKVTPQSGIKFISRGMSYYISQDGGHVLSAATQIGRSAYPGVKYVSFNTFLGQQNWLKLFNIAPSTTASATFEVFTGGGESIGSFSVTL